MATCVRGAIGPSALSPRNEFVLPNDQQHIPSFTYAMPLVVTSQRGSVVSAEAVYYAVQDQLRADNRPTIPRGVFLRLCRATGLVTTYRRDFAGRNRMHVHHIALTS